MTTMTDGAKAGSIQLTVVCGCGFALTPLGDCSHLEWPEGDGGPLVVVSTCDSCGARIETSPEDVDAARDALLTFLACGTKEDW